MDLTSFLGRCAVIFLIAVFFDAIGLVLFLLGIFGPFGFWDFLVLSGPIIIFLSLGCWIVWYLGNVTLSPTEFLPK